MAYVAPNSNRPGLKARSKALALAHYSAQIREQQHRERDAIARVVAASK